MIAKQKEIPEKQCEMIGQISGRLDSIDGRLDMLGTDVSEPKADIKVLDERSLRFTVFGEADVTRSLGRLNECHGAIMEKLDRLASQEHVDEQESDKLL